MAAFFKINCLFPLFCGGRIFPAFQELTFRTQVSAAVRENVIGGDTKQYTTSFLFKKVPS